MLSPRIKAFAQRLLPRFLLARLDPVQEIIAGEVRDAAESMRDGEIALDAGAGEAKHRQYFPKDQYIALDKGSGDPSWDYSQLDVFGDLEDLPIREQSLNYVLCMVVLEHTRNPGKVLAEFGRILKPGGNLHLVVPLLWEEHQAPNDYFRFTRHGMRYLFEGLPFRLELLEPMGGIFRVCARRCVNILQYFQGGWRWILFFLSMPFLGFLLPLLLHALDGLDRQKHFTLGFRIRATKEHT